MSKEKKKSLEEAQAALETAKSDLAKANEQLEVARKQAARYRVQRNAALKAEHAQAAVLKAHNIGFDTAKADTSKLEIKDGIAHGEFDYSPPKPSGNGRAAKDPPGETPGALTFEDLKGMTAEQMTERWEEVEKVLASTPRSKSNI